MNIEVLKVKVYNKEEGKQNQERQKKAKHQMNENYLPIMMQLN